MLEKELPLAGPGEFIMDFAGKVDIPNKFGKQSFRFVFVDGKQQANVVTSNRMLEGGDLDNFATQMTGRELAIGETFLYEPMIGEKFTVTVQKNNGFDRVTDVKPVGGNE